MLGTLSATSSSRGERLPHLGEGEGEGKGEGEGEGVGEGVGEGEG